MTVTANQDCYTAKVSFKVVGEIKTFQTKNKLREAITTEPVDIQGDTLHTEKTVSTPKSTGKNNLHESKAEQRRVGRNLPNTLKK